jgi:predicted ribosome-associated RNA-binding protein Tma20
MPELGEDEDVIFIPNRYDAEVSPKRHPCDIKNYEEQIVIVDSSCGAAILRGADIFAPGLVTCTETFVGDIGINVELSTFG